MFALIVVTAAVLMVLGLVYGFGALIFSWWDGGVMRRMLITACGLIVLYAIVILLRRHLPTG